MLEGVFRLMQSKNVRSEKSGKDYRVLQFGDPETCSSFEVILPDGLGIPAGTKLGDQVRVQLELKGSRSLYATLKTLGIA